MLYRAEAYAEIFSTRYPPVELPQPFAFLVEPSVILGSKSALRFFLARFSVKYVGLKHRELPRFLLAMFLYSLPAVMLYAYAFRLVKTVNVSFRKYVITLSRLQASLAMILLLTIGYAMVVYAFDAFLFGPLVSAEYLNNASFAEFALRHLRSRSASLFARIITILSTAFIYLDYPLAYTIFAFTTMHFVARIPIVIGYEAIAGAFRPLSLVSEYVGLGFSSFSPNDPFKAAFLLDLPNISLQAFASYAYAIIFVASAILGGFLTQEYVHINPLAAYLRLFLVAYTFFTRIKIDEYRKLSLRAFIAGLSKSEAEERLKGYVMNNLKRGHENTLKAVAIIVSAIVNVLRRVFRKITPSSSANRRARGTRRVGH